MEEDLLAYIAETPRLELDWRIIDTMINLIYEQEDNRY